MRPGLRPGVGRTACVCILVGLAPFASARTTLAATSPAIARPANGSPAPAVAANGSIHDVPRASGPISIDGRLDESAWTSALRFDLRFEVRPGENIEPPVRTECLLTYGSDALFVAFRAHDPHPEAIRARYSDRDRAWNDDWVGIVLDTFNDQRRAYELFSNPLGVQLDAINDEVGGSYDDSWNAIWRSKGTIGGHGYDVEMAIPFDQIRFQAGGGRQTWGFDAIRSYPRGDRHHIGLFPRDRNKSSYLSQTVKLIGMDGADPGRNLELVPTFTATRADSRESLPDGPLRESASDEDFGATLRWGITPNLTLGGTVNPDFSQVEADAVQLDVNEQFALFFDETRPFFLEQADFFNDNLGLVYTRTVADPSTAAKLTGKAGRHTMGVFVARDDVTNVVLPGSQGSRGGSFRLENTTAVGRYRWDFGDSSTIGATVTDRRGGDYANSVVSLDGLVRLSDEDTISFGIGQSRTAYDPEMIADLDADAETVDGGAFRLRYSHNERDYWINATYDDFGKGWRSDVGFRPQVDFSKWVLGGARVWWGEGDSFFNRMALGADVDRSVDQAGNLIEEELESWWNFNAGRESYVSFGAGRRNRVFEAIEFEQWFVNGYFEMQASPDWYVSTEVNWSDWIDFGRAREADRWIVRPSLRGTIGRRLRIDLSWQYQTLDVDEGRLFRIHAPEARIVHQFTARAFVRAILQFTDIERDPTLFDDAVDRTSRDLLAQLLVSYKINPATAFYLGYTDALVGTDGYSLTTSGRSLFLKLGYAWSP